MFLDSYSNTPLPEHLDIYFGPPEAFFIAPDKQALYTHNRLLAILDNGNFGLVLLLDPDSRALVQMDIESPDDSRTTFQHWQQYLAELMIWIGESVDEDARLRHIATLVGFAHTDALFTHLAETEGLTATAGARTCSNLAAGTPWIANNIRNRVLKPLLKRLGIPAAGLHAFRHGRVTVLRKRGTPADLQKLWIGHSSLRTGDRYSHTDEELEYRRAAAANVGLDLVVRANRAKNNEPSGTDAAAVTASKQVA